MRNSIGGAWLLGIVLSFMAIFIAYIAISFNYSHAFQMKTEMLNVIEQYQGINPTSLARVEQVLDKYGYRVKGTCEADDSGNLYLGVSNGSVTRNPQDPQNYCIYREKYNSGGTELYYYSVRVFFKFSLPVLGNLFNFNVSSETNGIEYPNDTYF